MNFLNNLSNLQKGLILAIVAAAFYFSSATISYSLFASSDVGNSLTGVLPSPKKDVDDSEPKTESCPLNGSMHSKKAKVAWEKRRPLGVMVENSVDARPQSGISSAEIVYEAVAEGGITRFMAVYLCSFADTQVGPVRSARTYFLDWISEYDGLYAHVGGANCSDPPFGPGCQNGAKADALGQIVKYKIKALNQFGLGYPTFWRDYERLGKSVATEHTMYSTTHKLWEAADKRKWSATDSAGIGWDTNFIPWKFKEDAPVSTNPKITVGFWEGYQDFVVDWEYEASCNCYKRKNGGIDHMDLNTNKQLTVKNIVVQFMKESRANDGYENNLHLLYGTIGQGKIMVFRDGKVVEGTWKKPTRLSRTIYSDLQSKEILFNKGLIWIQTIPDGNKINY